eukprot:TRINITY_DN1108_c0_g2_i1.p2 TRINITY_DN1108_c0_g2~~TRINITY_DN1108_c0_g2_i1.p2  ORF type:complete len:232 (-),score=25.63 TRINITY_DN1108_c0_g2_i1:123-818(-)
MPFAVVPRTDCPHLASHVPISNAPIPADLARRFCAACGDFDENWLCLRCHKIHCSRYVMGHALEHARGAGNRPKTTENTSETNGNEPGTTEMTGNDERATTENGRNGGLDAHNSAGSEESRTENTESGGFETGNAENEAQNGGICTENAVFEGNEAKNDGYDDGNDDGDDDETYAHPCAVSFSDLSVWCFECDSYVTSELVHPVLQRVHEALFGEPSGAYGSGSGGSDGSG